MCKWRMKELIYEVPEEELKVKTIKAIMDATFAAAKESLKKFRLVRDLNAMNDVEVTRLTNNDNKQNSSVYNNQTPISRDKNLRTEHEGAEKIKKKQKQYMAIPLTINH